MSQIQSPPYSNTLITPIYQTATYFFENTEQVVQYHNGESTMGRYGRYHNPSWLVQLNCDLRFVPKPKR